MAKDKKSVLLYCDIIHTVEELDDIDAGLLFKHYLRYINDQNPEPPSKLIKIVFEPIKQNLKRDLKKWDETIQSRSIAGKAGAEARWQGMANDSKRINAMAKMAVKDTVTDNVNDTDKVTYTKEDVSELSFFISKAYRKKYNREEGIGQDIDYMSKRLLSSMDKRTITDQVTAHRNYILATNLTLPSKLETIQSALLETDWVQRMKEKNDSETIQSQLTNEQARNKYRAGSGSEEIAPAYNGRIDTD